MQSADSNAILTRDEVAEWLKVKPRQVERLGIPQIDLGWKTKRYFAQDVLAWLHAKRVEPRSPHKVEPPFNRQLLSGVLAVRAPSGKQPGKSGWRWQTFVGPEGARRVPSPPSHTRAPGFAALARVEESL